MALATPRRHKGLLHRPATTSGSSGSAPMTDTTHARNDHPAAEPRSGGGLRLRIWIACLAGTLVSGGGIWWVVGTQLGAGPNFDLATAVSWLGLVAGFGVAVGAVFALWLDHGIVVHARGLAQAMATRQTARLRGLPGASGWGELSLLTQQVQQLVTQYRGAERAAEELGMVRDQLMMLHESLERWNETERWRQPKSEGAVVTPVIDSIGRGLRRLDDWRDQNLEVARQIAGELERAVSAARECSEQAERGFVEATALLTTVRELQRLQTELKQTLAEADPSESGASVPGVAAAAREAIEDLVIGSTEAVERLANGLRRVEEIADQGALLANRATLIALESVIGGQPAAADRAHDTRQLVVEIRATVDRTSRLSQELAAEVSAAGRSMHEVRERVAHKLERLPAATGPARPREEVERLFERVREMIQDATRKGERLSAAGERASRAAEALLRSLESEGREMEGLMVRLTPVSAEGDAPEVPHAPPPARPGPAMETGGLRLLGKEDLLSDPFEGRAPGAGEEPR